MEFTPLYTPLTIHGDDSSRVRGIWNRRTNKNHARPDYTPEELVATCNWLNDRAVGYRPVGGASVMQAAPDDARAPA